MPIKTPPATGVVTTTIGTGSYALGAALAMDGDTLLTFSEAEALNWIDDGDQVYYVCKNASGAREIGIGTYNHGAQTLARTSILKSTNGNNAVVWGSGDKALFVAIPPDLFMTGANNLSELTNLPASRTALELGTAAVLNTGTTENTIPKLLAGTPGKLPVIDGSNLVGLASAFASGTVMIFGQAAAPTGWTKLTTQNDKALRIVSGSGGGAGGSRVLSSANVADHTLVTNEMPSHVHDVRIVDDSMVAGAGGIKSRVLAGLGPVTQTTEFAGADLPHSHGLALAYFDVIMCSKN